MSAVPSIALYGESYHDAQIIRTEMMAYVYSPCDTPPFTETHAAMMGMICGAAVAGHRAEYTYEITRFMSGGLAAGRPFRNFRNASGSPDRPFNPAH